MIYSIQHKWIKRIISFFIMAILCSFVSVSYGQFSKIKVKSKSGGSRVIIKKNHPIIVFNSSTKFKGTITDIGPDFIQIRINDRFPTKVEYETIPNINIKWEAKYKAGWVCISDVYHGHTAILKRSLDFEKIYFKNIDHIQYSKSETTPGFGFETLFLFIGFVTTPIWNYKYGSFDWETFGILGGLVSGIVIYSAILNERHKLKTYSFKDYHIMRIK